MRERPPHPAAHQTSTSPPLKRVGFSLGSNIGDRLASLEAICDHLSAVLGPLRLSQVYETEPVNCPEGSPPYLNACIEASADLPPEDILKLCLQTEQKLGRTRNGQYGEPRTCDIDILYYGDLRCNTTELTLPHPRAHLREFVLRPLCDIDPYLILPGQNRTVSELLSTLPPGPSVRPYNL